MVIFKKNEVLIRSYFQPDDHDNPTFLILPDERVMLFYSRHTDEACFYYRISTKPGDITTLGEEHKLKTANNTTYPSPFILSDDPNNIYLCWRGINWHPTIAKMDIPDTEGKTDFNWGPYQIVQSSGSRPYAKYMSNGKDKIYLSYTTGHPDNEYPNYLYFNYVDIKTLQLKDIKGKTLSTIKNGVFNINKTSSYVSSYPNTVVDNKSTSRNWLWQTEQDADGNPVIAMVQISENKNSHDYYHVKWTGSEWRKTFLTNAGGKFHQTPGLELCYSGGMAIDDANTDIIYCSAPVKGNNGDIYEILKFTLDKNGNVESREQITKNSVKNNARPYLIPGSENSPLRLSWMNGDYYDWIVSNTRPQGYPTGINCDYDFPSESIDLNNSLIKNLTFEEPVQGNAVVNSGVAVFTKDSSIEIPVNIENEFSLILSPYIFNNSYNGTIFSSSDLSWNLDEKTLKPYIQIGENRYYSSNLLGSSDVWKTQGRGTGGQWYTPTKFEYFNLAVTYSNGKLRTYINGLIDQYIEIDNIKLKDVILGGYTGWMEDCRIYSRELNQEEIKSLAVITSQQTLDKNLLNEIGRIELSVPSNIWSDILLPSKTVTGENIVWNSNNPSVISNKGIVKNPSVETYVTLKAVISDFEKEFISIVMPRDITKNQLLSYEFESDQIYTTEGITYVTDTSGKGNDLAVFGNARINNGSLDLTSNTSSGFSSNGYAIAPSNILEGLRSYTVFMKVNPKHLDKAPRFFDFGSASSNSLFGRGKNLTTGIKYNGTSTQMVNANTQITTGKESFIAYTFDANSKTSKIYIDGKQVATGSTFTYEPYQLFDIAKDNRNYIGRTQWWDTNVAGDNIDYCGKIDNFNFYNIALTPDEIKYLQDYATPVNTIEKIKDFSIKNNHEEKKLSISLEEKYNNSIAKISSLTGNLIAESTLKFPTTDLNFDISDGVYVLNIIKDGINVFSTDRKSVV